MTKELFGIYQIEEPDPELEFDFSNDWDQDKILKEKLIWEYLQLLEEVKNSKVAKVLSKEKRKEI